MTARKMAYQLQEHWAGDPVCREKCDELVSRVDLAVQRLQRREEKRAAWKEQENEALNSLIRTPTRQPAASDTPAQTPAQAASAERRKYLESLLLPVEEKLR